MFDYTKQKKVLRLNVGDTITYTGKLVSLRGLFSPYRLDDVDFFRVR
jgi:tartrate dehydratase beta subunit/fumarate hydratase class I family protein